ncbi:MAG: S8 family serine peptidase [Bacteroidales bacterium]|nr:S8 family serine peptidase [Bacteroidales bacterium]
MEMVHRNLITFFAAAMVCACAVVDEKDVQMPSGAADDPMTKVVGLSEEVDGRTFLVKFDVPQDEASLKETGLRNGLSFSRLFRSTPGKEALEAEFGLDRWYVAALEGDGVLADAVSRMAEMSSVSLVQYNSIARKASDCVVYPFEDDEPDTKATASSFNDPDLKYQWHYDNQGNASIATSARKGADINVTDVWSELTCGDPSIIVAVVDEGVKHSHPDLKDNMWVNEGEIAGNGIDDDGNGYVDDVHGYNFVTDGPVEWTADGNSGHGTHCAGTIAAVNNNGVGVAGVAGGSGSNDGCRIMSCQIFSGREGGTVMQSVNAIKYAADMGASIISCSFGYTAAFPSDNAYIKSQGSAEIDAVHYFEACRNNTVLDGNIAIFASGNDAHDYAHYPGAFHDIISVTAFGPDNLPTHYTNYGPGCNIAAPGGEAYLPPWKSYKALVLSTVPSELVTNGEASSSKGNDYGYMQGTSMACPHVSGVVALALSYAKKIGKTFERDRFKDMIITSANDMDQYLKGTKSYVGRADLNLAPFYHKLGTGSLDAWLLMMQIEGIPSLTAEIGRKQWLDLSAYFGTASTSLTYLGLEVSDAGRESLGLAEEPYIEYGRLYIHPTKPGSAKITIKAVGGGDEVGGGDNVGGMEISQEVSVIARSFVSENGGWL